jgi:Tol biopolymer transport system component
MPRWTGGDRVTFVSVLRGGQDLHVTAADGTGDPELLFDHEVDIWEGFLGPGGEWLVFTATGVSGAVGSRDILAVRPEEGGEVLPLLAEEYDEAAPVLSPDGRWLAYASDETGGYEVYVRPFPDVDAGRWTISTDGGGAPLWAHSGQELFYVSADRDLVSVRVDSSDGFRVSSRSVLFSLPDPIRLNIRLGGQYDVTPDDRRFVMVRVVEGRDTSGADDATTEWVLVRNWFQALEARVPN